jgi:hypothetical protein
LAFSPDRKTLALRFSTNEIHISEVPDLNVRPVLRPDASANMTPGAVAFDPGGQFLASAAGDENV